MGLLVRNIRADLFQSVVPSRVNARRERSRESRHEKDRERKRNFMKNLKKVLCIMLACVALIGVLPAHAAAADKPYTLNAEVHSSPLPRTLRYSWGRDGMYSDSGWLNGSTEYMIADGKQLTVTNTTSGSNEFLYLYCEVYHPQDFLVDSEGASLENPNEYYLDVDKDLYMLCKDGSWMPIPMGYDLIGATAELDARIFAGESMRFDLPNVEGDCEYLLHIYYVDLDEINEIEEYYTSAHNFIFRRGEPAHGSFEDLYSNTYYYDAVAWALENNVTTGTSATTFSPTASVTRAQAATFLWRAAGMPEPTSSVSPFTDVTDPSAYYYKAILWATEQGIVGGVGNGRFSVDGTLTYAQILAMVCRADGGDASGNDWSATALQWADENGLTDGLEITADKNCPRANVVYFLWK